MSCFGDKKWGKMTLSIGLWTQWGIFCVIWDEKDENDGWWHDDAIIIWLYGNMIMTLWSIRKSVIL